VLSTASHNGLSKAQSQGLGICHAIRGSFGTDCDDSSLSFGPHRHNLPHNKGSFGTDCDQFNLPHKKGSGTKNLQEDLPHNKKAPGTDCDDSTLSFGPHRHNLPHNTRRDKKGSI
jgi:hypothetical protein